MKHYLRHILQIIIVAGILCCQNEILAETVHCYTYNTHEARHIDNQPKDQQLILYPNPVKNKLQVLLNFNNAKPTIFVIYDLLGNEIGKQEIATDKNDYVFNMENSKPGIYFLKVLEGNRTLAVKKFILE